MVETWRQIAGHDGYEISESGKIRSYRNRQGHQTQTPRMLTPGIVNGYLYIKLGRTFQSSVHLLVLKTFVGPCPPGMVARHLDGVRTNCHVTNLAWGTLEENYADRRVHGTDNGGIRHWNSKFNDDLVRDIRARIAIESPQEIAASLGVTQSAIRHVIAKRSWQHVS